MHNVLLMRGEWYLIMSSPPVSQHVAGRVSYMILKTSNICYVNDHTHHVGNVRWYEYVNIRLLVPCSFLANSIHWPRWLLFNHHSVNHDQNNATKDGFKYKCKEPYDKTRRKWLYIVLATKLIACIISFCERRDINLIMSYKFGRD